MVQRIGKPLRVGIVGMGTAGMACALGLARTGKCSVTLYEKEGADRLHQSLGAGIGMQPIGLSALEKLSPKGLEMVLKHGARVDTLHATTRKNVDVLKLSYADFDKRLFGLGLHRSVLHEALLCEVLEERSIKVHMGQEAIGARIAHTKAEYSIDKDHSYIKLEEGGSFDGPFDLIIAADGRSSPIRRSLKAFGLRAFEWWYRFGCVWSVLPDEHGFLQGREHVLTQKLDGCEKMLGFLPTGHACGDLDGTPLVSMFWSLDMTTVDSFRTKGLDSFKEQVVSLEPRAERLLEKIESMDSLIDAYYSNTLMPSYVFGKSLAIVGDAAHAVSPQLGQGSNLALVDAMYLARALEKKDFSVPEALIEYNRSRKWRTRFYQLNSMLLTPVFQSHSKSIALLRDALMGPLCKFPPTRQQMLATLTGAQKNGIPYRYIPQDEYVLERNR